MIGAVLVGALNGGAAAWAVFGGNVLPLMFILAWDALLVRERVWKTTTSSPK